MTNGAILVFGETGQVARELALQAPVTTLSRAQADLMDPAACAAAIHAHRPRAVINAAAWTAVDKAEAEEEAATTINADAPAAMARACADMGIPLVQISTDYVFDGTGTAPWAPDALTAPLGAYGRSKLKGEEAVRAAGCPHVILRTSWVFSAHGANFVKTMLRLGAERPILRVVADQVGGPTPAAAIAAACLTIADRLVAAPGLSGTHHFAGTPDTTWADFARAIMQQAGLPAQVEGIATADYPTPARRPANSRLDCSALARDFGISRPDWRAGLADVLATLGRRSAASGGPP
jgi:dTDP-4-dehydrorhamnose reductase